MTEVIHMRKPGKWVFSRARETELKHLQANRYLYFLFALFMIALAVAAGVTYSYLGEQWAGWLMAGVVLGGTATMFTYEIRLAAGTAHKREGGNAELRTHDALRQIDSAEVVDGLFLQPFDIDHIVVSPDGILSVETKWTSFELELVATDKRLNEFLYCAHRSQDKTSKFIRHMARSNAEVGTCLVLWGPHVPDTPGGAKLIDGVVVLVGRQWKSWVSLFNQNRLSEADRLAIVKCLRDYEERQLTQKPTGGKGFRSRLSRPIATRS